MIGIALGQRYPRSIHGMSVECSILSEYQSSLYLHGDESVIDEDFFGEEIGSNSGLIAPTELLVDLMTAKSDRLAL